jgi:hypothetical protein
MFFVFVVVSLVTGFNAHAQDSGTGGDDFGLFLGYMLPNQIDGVTDIVPIFGGRYAFGLSGVGALELEGMNTHSEGIDFTTIGASLRGEIPVMHGIHGIVYGGPDLHYYIPRGDTVRHTDYGVHVGIGGMMLVTDTLWLRTDLRFNGNPGTALLLLFGAMFRIPGGS